MGFELVEVQEGIPQNLNLEGPMRDIGKVSDAGSGFCRERNDNGMYVINRYIEQEALETYISYTQFLLRTLFPTCSQAVHKRFIYTCELSHPALLSQIYTYPTPPVNQWDPARSNLCCAVIPHSNTSTQHSPFSKRLPPCWNPSPHATSSALRPSSPRESLWYQPLGGVWSLADRR